MAVTVAALICIGVRMLPGAEPETKAASPATASFWLHWVSQGIYVLVALIWLIPDRRIERMLSSQKN
jgi:hypothetical protein